ncbi:serine/threonine-protein kinase [Streptomyces sp. S.PNR 29]|uniref:serine/threonine protein kinase n=1 Tax=Streptomyces sp. S.PNR 29 TaxID=2973805 RepID=UPI0025B0D156|nr:serine/threonine-protein kinase [Streptomyces sp. S.PNR 29]MDN0199023.1 serine/threonine protein kinase [Streptomyces sp. S.PNR 29]
MGRAHVSTHELVAGRYRLLEVVHRETNRMCWYAEDTQDARPCLVTQIGLPDDPDGTAGRVTSRLVHTSETVARLCPGRVATVVDAVEEYGSLWTVTEWIDGVPLGDILAERGPFDHVRTARTGLQILEVLQAAHGEGITHGELSPGQVFVREEGSIVVTGFGLAGATLAPRLAAPSYASPEQARDERIGPAADLWALGAILYTMVEGRPPFRDRGRPEATLKGVDRLPLRTPVRAGPLAQVVQGLLRKDSRERLTRPVVREALTRVLTEDPDVALQAAPGPRLRGAYAAAFHMGRAWSRRTMVAGTTLAVVTVAVGVLAATQGLPGTDTGADDSATGAQQLPSAPASGIQPSPSASAPGTRTPSPSASVSPPGDRTEESTPRPTATPSPSAPALPPGYRSHHSPEGFSVALPEGWKPLQTRRAEDATRVIFGADGDHRTLTVTYSERGVEDPVAVWRDEVEPNLKQAGGYRRIGEIRATTYQGREAADMEWVATIDGVQLRTFGRGFLLEGGRSFSLRWTTPADDWEDAENEEALKTFLRTFRPASD